MKVYKVYKHPKKDRYQVNKVGFTWCGIIFNFFWCLDKRLFLYGIMMFIYMEFLNVWLDWSERIPFQEPDVLIFDILLFLIWVFVWLLLGFKGNQWAGNKAERRGFTLINSFEAPSKKAAIALAKNEERTSELDLQKSYKAVNLTKKEAKDKKECPMCAETVKAKAKICRFCKYEFK